MNDPAAREVLLRNSLLGDHQPLYWGSGNFHHSIDLLVAWLPLWVDALATAAEKSDVEARMRLRILEIGLPKITLDELHEQGIG